MIATNDSRVSRWRNRIVDFLRPRGRQGEEAAEVREARRASPIARLETVKQKTLESLQHPVQRMPARVERRAWVRRPSNLQGSCRPVSADKGVQWQARVVDVSQGGVCLYLRHSFEPGTVLSLSLQGDDPGSSHLLVMRIVRTHPHPVSGYLMGCQFARPISDDEVEALLVLREVFGDDGLEMPEALAPAEHGEESSLLETAPAGS